MAWPATAKALGDPSALPETLSPTNPKASNRLTSHLFYVRLSAKPGRAEPGPYGPAPELLGKLLGNRRRSLFLLEVTVCVCVQIYMCVCLCIYIYICNM